MLRVVELSDEQINNCLVFLNRAQLTGNEAEALVAIKVALSQAQIQQDYLKAFSTRPESKKTPVRGPSAGTSQAKGGDTNED